MPNNFMLPRSRNAMQSAHHVLMIRPVRFWSNPATAANNAFQHADPNPALSQMAAQKEFDSYVKALRAAGVEVLVVEDSAEPHTPDAIFPNNWFSCDRQGRVYLYPMEAPSRRLERRMAVLAEIERHFVIDQLIDLGRFTGQSQFLEGTGSMVLDHLHRIAYICHSSRSHPAVMRAFSEHSGYQAHWFHAVDRNGKPIYHTNVMMCVGATLAIVCLDAVRDVQERYALTRSLHDSGKKIIAISLEQMGKFCGNMLELRAANGTPVFAVSRSGWAALKSAQQSLIVRYAKPVLAPIDTIERCGGGSARCMVAEVFLPQKSLRPTLTANASETRMATRVRPEQLSLHT